MVFAIPSSWTYSNDLENLLFFYQCSEELLSNNSPDSYRLPTCNSISLCSEIRRIYKFLSDSKQIDRYYSKYIPCIIDELIDTIHGDNILKKALGFRLESVITGLTSAKENHRELVKWINLMRQSCTLRDHANACKAAIIKDVQAGNNKAVLQWHIQNYYIDLISIGYSTEYLFQSVIRFFDNKSSPIVSSSCIVKFLESFDMEEHEFEFYVVADTLKMDNFSRINPQVGRNFSIHEVDTATITTGKRTNATFRKMCETYEDLKSRGNTNVKILSCKAEELDPYSAFDDISEAFDLAQCFEGYFKHKSERKTFFDVLLVLDGHYRPIRQRRVIPTRPYIDQSTIDRRMEAILHPTCSMDVIFALLRAMDMHLDALNCKNASTMLRSFWTALEALFFTADESAERENAKFCLIAIIQKTYLLKQFRFLYDHLTLAITDETFWEEMNISCFQDFVKVFMSVRPDSGEFKKFTARLNTTPLLRSRIYWFRKELSDAKHIKKKIEEHKQKVSWHIDRIYRTRNLSTHAGITMPYTKEILFNIHNYFDYVTNYIVCKLENEDYIASISSMIFEAKNDNQIHCEFLKTVSDITDENYLNVLFGPDIKIVTYDFEALVSVPSAETD